MAKRPLKPEQIKLIQTAVRAAGLRDGLSDGRYRLVLAQYKRSDGTACGSCKDLNNWQVDDLLAICEGLGWRHPGKPEDYYRSRTRQANGSYWATPGQSAAIQMLAGDLGWTEANLNGMIARMTHQRSDCLTLLTRADGYVMIEAMLAMLSRRDGQNYKTLADAEAAYAGRSDE